MNGSCDALNDDYAAKSWPAILFLSAVMVTGSLGNLLVCVVYRFDLSKVNTRFILALTGIDLINCLISIPGEILDLRYRYSFGYSWYCQGMTFSVTFCSISGAIILLAISVERFQKVCKPFGRQTSLRASAAAIYTSLALSMCCAAPAAILKRRRTGVVDGVQTATCDRAESDTQYSSPRIYNIFLFSLFTIGCLILTVLYCFIWHRLRRQRQFRNRFGSLSSNNNERMLADEVLPLSDYIPVASSSEVAPVMPSSDVAPVSSSEFPPVTSSSDLTPVTSSSNFTPVTSSPDSTPVTSSSYSKYVTSSSRSSLTSTYNTTSKASSSMLTQSTSTSIMSQSKSTSVMPRSQSTSVITVKRPSSSGSRENDTESSYPPSNKMKQRDKTEKMKTVYKSSMVQKTTITMLLLTIVHILSFLPYLSLVTARDINPKSFMNLTNVQIAFYELFSRFHFLNSALNPFIYNFFNLQFKEKLRNLKRRCLR